MTNIVQRSEYLTQILLHAPGWVDVSVILDSLGWEREHLDEVVAAESGRVEYDSLLRRLRVRQTESYSPGCPPDVLYHGTLKVAVPSILAEGLKKMGQAHVYLASTIEMAQIEGGRRGESVVLEVASGLMQLAGFTFYQAANGVWLTDHVPAGYVKVREPGHRWMVMGVR